MGYGRRCSSSDVTPGFRRTRRGIEVQLSRDEARLLRSLLSELLGLLHEEGSGAPADPLEAMVGISEGELAPPADPALARLLPDGYRDDPEAAAEFRRYTEPSLRAGKRAAARTVLATLPDAGGRLHIDDAAAQAWLSSLNDLRLALGTRLDVTDDMHDRLAAMRYDDPALPELLLYDWLGFIEETLVEVLDR
jgi:hypothetical protein